MLAEIRGRSQITIPSEIIKKLGISEGDKFDIMERDGGIFLCPVVVYPKDKIAKIAKILKQSENDTKARTAFESVEDMYKLKYTKEFERDLKKLSAAEQKQTANKLKLLMQNPFYPSLRTKKVQGLDNVFEMSVNMDIRILWRYENGVIILLIDIGHHKDILGL